MVSLPHLPEFNSADGELYILYFPFTTGNGHPSFRGGGAGGSGPLKGMRQSGWVISQSIWESGLHPGQGFTSG
jgi:hypothetical protein